MGFKLSRAFKNVGKTLFGESPKTTMHEKDLLTPEQMEALTDEALPALSKSAQPFTGQISAGMTEGEKFSLAALEEQAKGIATGASTNDAIKSLTGLLSAFQSSQSGAGGTGESQASTGADTDEVQRVIDLLRDNESPISGDVQSALSRMLSGETTGFDEYYEQVVKQPLLEEFQRDILPAISRNYATGQNFRGSERVLQDARAQEALLKELTRSRADLAYKDRRAVDDNILKAAGIATDAGTADQSNLVNVINTVLQNQLGRGQLELGEKELGARTTLDAAGQLLDQPGKNIDNLLKTLEASGYEREVAQADLDRIREEFHLTNDEEAKRLALLLQAIGINIKENIATVTPGKRGLISDVAGAAGAYFGAKS